MSFKTYLSEKYINEDYREVKNKMMTLLSNKFGDIYNNNAEWLFNAEAAIYWYSHEYYDSQSSDLFKILSTTDYKPASDIKSIADEDKKVQDMFTVLVGEYQELNDEGM